MARRSLLVGGVLVCGPPGVFVDFSGVAPRRGFSCRGLPSWLPGGALVGRLLGGATPSWALGKTSMQVVPPGPSSTRHIVHPVAHFTQSHFSLSPPNHLYIPIWLLDHSVAHPDVKMIAAFMPHLHYTHSVAHFLPRPKSSFTLQSGSQALQ
jgi:hypothetical protein